MKILKRTEMADESVNVTINLKPGEHALVSPQGNVLIILESRHYKLGGQVEDVVSGDIITEICDVSWCSVSQQWVE